VDRLRALVVELALLVTIGSIFYAVAVSTGRELAGVLAGLAFGVAFGVATTRPKETGQSDRSGPRS